MVRTILFIYGLAHELLRGLNATLILHLLQLPRYFLSYCQWHSPKGPASVWLYQC